MGSLNSNRLHRRRLRRDDKQPGRFQVCWRRTEDIWVIQKLERKSENNSVQFWDKSSSNLNNKRPILMEVGQGMPPVSAIRHEQVRVDHRSECQLSTVFTHHHSEGKFAEKSFTSHLKNANVQIWIWILAQIIVNVALTWIIENTWNFDEIRSRWKLLGILSSTKVSVGSTLEHFPNAYLWD